MNEEQIELRSEGVKIEGRIHRQDGMYGVVVTHPHPLYGGDMHNHVVAAVVRAYQGAGFSTLRFNFRGVGRSEGEYGEGRDEQADVRAALDRLLAEKKTAVHLAGYSFGAWVIALGLDAYPEVEKVLLVSPPVAFMDFGGMHPSGKVGLVITGARDDIAPPAMLRGLVARWNPGAVLEVIPGSDHFYAGKVHELEGLISRFLEGARGSSPAGRGSGK